MVSPADLAPRSLLLPRDPAPSRPPGFLPPLIIRLPAALQAQTSCQLPYPERFSEAAKFVAERECSTKSAVGGRHCDRRGAGGPGRSSSLPARPPTALRRRLH